MTAERYVLLEGVRGTRSVLAEWNRKPWRTLGGWVGLSLLISIGLLYSVYAVAKFSVPDPMKWAGIPGINRPAAGYHDAKIILYRNSLVLALHAMVCVAVFIATSSLPAVSANMSRTWKKIHDVAGQLSLAFVAAATIFSLVTQAYALGGGAADMAALLETKPSTLIFTLLPHALPELTAVFLPLAACLIATAKGQMDRLMAATFVTVAIGFPTLLACAAIEVWFTPLLLRQI